LVDECVVARGDGAPVKGSGDGTEVGGAHGGGVCDGPAQASDLIIGVAVEMGVVVGRWKQFGIAETVGEQGIAAAVDGFEDADTEEFVMGGGNDHVGFPQQAGVGS